jgi:hypothetical protein
MSTDFRELQEVADTDHRAAKAMEKWGGGFAAALAVAYFHADADNKARILAAWPELFERYRRMSTGT